MLQIASLVDAETRAHRISIGQKLIKFRTEKGLSQHELSNLCNKLDRGRISQMENGTLNYTIDSLHEITKGLGITIEDLFIPWK